MRTSVTTAPHLTLYVNGLAFGRASSFAWTIDTPSRPIQTVDLLTPAELAPGPTRVTGRIGVYRTNKDGGAEGAGLAVPVLDTARGRYVGLMLVDRRSDTVVFRADRARISQQSWAVASRGLVTGQVSFEAIDASDEIPPTDA